MKRIFVMYVINGKYVYLDDLNVTDYLKHEKKYQEQYLQDRADVIFVKAENIYEAEEIANKGDK